MRESITDSVFRLKDEYEELVDQFGQQWPEPMSFSMLCRIRGSLSSKAVDLAKITSKHSRNFNKYAAQRKVQFFLEQVRLMTNGKSDDGVIIKSATASEPFAYAHVSELRLKEAESKGLKDTSNIILNQANELLKSINQDIAILRKEVESIHERS